MANTILDLLIADSRSGEIIYEETIHSMTEALEIADVQYGELLRKGYQCKYIKVVVQPYK